MNTYGGWENETVVIYDTISWVDPRIENLEFTLSWKSHRLGVNSNYVIDVRAKWQDVDTITTWYNKSTNSVVNDRKFAEYVVGDYIVSEDETSTELKEDDYIIENMHPCYNKLSKSRNTEPEMKNYKWNSHEVKVQIPTTYNKNDVLCLSFGGGKAGGYLRHVELKVSFTYNPNKTDNNAKSTAINEVRNTVTDNAYYDFTGRKIAYPQSGHTYIHNGKLIRIK